MDSGPLEVSKGPPLDEVLTKARAQGKAKQKLAGLGVVLAQAMAAKMTQQKKDDET